MPMINESALQWVGDEVRATLGALKNELESLLEISAEQRTLVVISCIGKIRSVSGALTVANCELLAAYAQKICDVIELWHHSPSSLRPQAVNTAVMASQSLDDFLQAVQEKKSLSELTLFEDYQRLATTLSRPVSPLDLWPIELATRSADIWSQQEIATDLSREAKQRMDSHDPYQVEQLEVDALMLGLIRQQNSEAAATLQIYADWRMLKQQQPQQAVIGTLLSEVIAAAGLGKLQLDVHLKRYLLTGLNWLKGRDVSADFFNESVFFAYLVWQASETAINEVTFDPVIGLNHLALAASWQRQLGTNYSRVYFDPASRELLSKAQAALAVTKQEWGDFCAQPLPDTEPAAVTNLAMSFDKMGQSLEALHPVAGQVSQAFHSLVSNTKICSTRNVQVEVATLLMLLGSMLSDMKGRDDELTERRMRDVSKRIRHLAQGRMPGAFEPWMLELQQRQDWILAMTSTTDLLVQKLTEIEGILERFWASPDDRSQLLQVPPKMQQISAIARSLKLDDFANAALPVEAKIETFIENQDAMDETSQKQLAADLAGLGIMLTMWAHKPGHGTAHIPAQEGILAADAVMPMPDVAAIAIAIAATDEDESVEQIFLQEAQSVLSQAELDLAKLADQATDSVMDAEVLIGIRRAFHTLKGGARVVGLNDFGEAAWLLEQYLNDQLAEQHSLTPEALALLTDQVNRMQDWTRQLQALQHTGDSVLGGASAIDWQIDALSASLEQLAPANAAHAPAALTFELPPSHFLDLPATFSDEDAGSQIKVIEDLQISIPLYQAYLNESDEWSRQLALALSEWALDEGQPFPTQATTWAHSLAGSSATIGFESCAELAKLLEASLVKTQAQHSYSVDLAQTLSKAADEIRRLLHQFAAGFLKTADSDLIDKLQGYLSPTPEEPQQLQELLVEPIVTEPSTVELSPEDLEIKAIFEEESAQLIPALGAALRNWDKAEVLRTLHTLKGTARLVGEQALAERAHDLESQLEEISDQPTIDQHARLLQSYDQMVAPTTLPTQKTQTTKQKTATSALAAIATQPKPLIATQSGEAIRIQSSTVDRLVNQTGELMIARSRIAAEMTKSMHALSDMGVQVQRLRDQLRELELQTESQMQSRQALISDTANSFDPLELDRFTRTQEITRFMAEAVADISTLQRSLNKSLNTTEDDLAAQLRQTRDLQRYLLRTRMVEFNSVNERLHRLVRMSSAELGKSIELTIQNGNQEMDRSVLGRMIPVFEHLLRNSVVHGIEKPALREAMGKPAQGQITIQLSQQSNDVIVTVRDDGGGIDQQALLNKAKELTGQAQLDVNLTELIFMSGLSTATEISELAGRGIGMDVVRSQVLALGGRVEVDTTPREGSSFKLVLPLTTAVTQIVLVRTGSVLTGVPGNLVRTIVRVKPQLIFEAQENQFFEYDQNRYPFYGFSHLLQYKTTSKVLQQPTQNVMLLQSAGQTIALHVDEVLGNQEVMIKNLGVQLSQMPGLSGITVLPTGPTVLIYNPLALAAIYGPGLASEVALPVSNDAQHAELDHPDSDNPIAPLVLVVDDSITMRRVLQRLLQREGYRVAVAADGRQALDALALELPALVISDVEMPRMDGFELLSSIRASDRLSKLPVVMITSRIADKHRLHAKELGVNEYLGKPYAEDELLEILEQYCPKTTV